jgi:hypothetical protein
MNLINLIKKLLNTVEEGVNEINEEIQLLFSKKSEKEKKIGMLVCYLFLLTGYIYVLITVAEFLVTGNISFFSIVILFLFNGFLFYLRWRVIQRKSKDLLFDQ